MLIADIAVDVEREARRLRPVSPCHRRTCRCGSSAPADPRARPTSRLIPSQIWRTSCTVWMCSSAAAVREIDADDVDAGDDQLAQHLRRRATKARGWRRSWLREESSWLSCYLHCKRPDRRMCQSCSICRFAICHSVDRPPDCATNRRVPRARLLCRWLQSTGGTGNRPQARVVEDGQVLESETDDAPLLQPGECAADGFQR